MKIAVYTIAKNEEQFVERWYESAKEADYLLIADTGSTDGTVDKAMAFNIHVLDISINPWRFDDSRNAALAAIPSDVDFCIALDMDEILVPGWRQELEKIAEGTTRPRYQYTWSWEGDKPGLQYGGDKIHARHGYRWKHPVHEVLVTDRIVEVQEWIKLEIHHHPDDSKSRGQYFPLLELSVEEDPYDDRNSHYLAREYYFHGQLEKAAQEFKRHLSLPRAVWGPERAASLRYLAKCEPENAEEHLKKAIEEAPGHREAYVELAEYYYLNQDWAQCYLAATNALSIVEKPLDYLCEAKAWGYLPYDFAAISSYHLGMKEVSLGHGIKALELAPDDERLAQNLEFYKAN